jgi:hypothetical protein
MQGSRTRTTAAGGVPNNDPCRVNFAGSPTFGQKAALKGPQKLVGARSGRVNRAQTVPRQRYPAWRFFGTRATRGTGGRQVPLRQADPRWTRQLDGASRGRSTWPRREPERARIGGRSRSGGPSVCRVPKLSRAPRPPRYVTSGRPNWRLRRRRRVSSSTGRATWAAVDTRERRPTRTRRSADRRWGSRRG